MYKVIVDKNEIAKHDYKTAKVAGFKKLKELGLDDGFFGGRVHRIVMLKDSDSMLIIDGLHNTIGIMELKEKAIEVEVPVIVEELVKEVIAEEVIIEEMENIVAEKTMYSCEKCNREFDSRLKLGTHKRFCKVGGDD